MDSLRKPLIEREGSPAASAPPTAGVAVRNVDGLAFTRPGGPGAIPFSVSASVWGPSS